MIRRLGVSVAAAGLHAAALVGWVLAWRDGLGAGAWLTVAAASLAVAVEGSAQARADRVAQPWLETVTGLMLLALVLGASLGQAVGLRIGVAAGAMLAGVGLRGLAVVTLGEAFATRPRGDEALVTTGIYRWLRHPSEVGLLAMAGGLALLGGPPFGALWLALAAVAAWRVQLEERELTARFPARAAG